MIETPESPYLPAPPCAPKRPHRLVHHGDERVDPYYWLRDRNDPEVLAHLRAENDYTEACMRHTRGLQEEIFEEIRSRILETDLSVPVLDGPWHYYSRTVEGLQYAIHCRRPAPRAQDGSYLRPGPTRWTDPNAIPAEEPPPPDEEVILDENELAGQSQYFALGCAEVSPDHRFIAYSTDFTGAEVFDLWVKDLATGEVIDGPIGDTYYSVAWSKDATVLFYTRPDAAMRPYQVWRHLVGDSPEKDVLVYEEDDQRFNLSVSMTKDEELIVIEADSRITSETWVIPSDAPYQPARLVLERREGVEHSLEHFGSNFVILTNDDAFDFRIVVAPADDPDPARWVDLVPHRPGVRLEGFDLFVDHLVVFERSEGCARISVMGRTGSLGPHGVPWDPSTLRTVPQPEEVSTTWEASNPEINSRFLRYGYSSLVTPSSLYELDMETMERTVLKVQPVLGGYDPSAWVSERRWAVSDDGTRVPVSLVHAKSLSFPAPTLLYGYGSYEASMDPTFSSSRLSLLERGFVFAIAHVRGGGEMGRKWYEEGKLLAKRHSFEDFVAVARSLVEDKVTSPKLLVARGGSAGGLLMGAVANQAPELFAAIVAEVPFVDCLTTILDESLPLTVNEWEEWGNPVTSPEVYHYMKSYSPYDNVREGVRYPRILATAGLNDPRVSYWEPAKWVLKIRDAHPENVALLKTEMGAGHGGPSGRYDAWRDEAFVLAFVVDSVTRCTQDSALGFASG
jgi:oligopeptidase B